MSKQIGIPLGLLAPVFVLAWSSGFWIAKLGATVGPVTVLLWRFVLVSVLLWGLVALFRLPTPRSRGEWSRQSVIGLFSQLGYVGPVYAAVALGVSTGVTSLIDAIQPVVVATLVGPLLGRSVRIGQWAGLIIALLGALMIIGADLFTASAPPAAYLLIAAAVAGLVLATFLERRRVQPGRVPVLVMMAIHSTVGSAAMIIIAGLSGRLQPPGTWQFWAVVALLAVVPTLLGYAAYWSLLRRVDVTALNALLFLVVPTTTLGGVLLFAEPFTVITATGILVAAGGVGLVLAGERWPGLAAGRGTVRGWCRHSLRPPVGAGQDPQCRGDHRAGRRIRRPAGDSHR